MTTWWQFCGATAPPFTRDIPVDHLYRTPAHREWQARFQAVVADRGFAVLTGEAGVGKSTALRAVWQTLAPNQTWPCYLRGSDDWTPRQFYRILAQALDCPDARFPEVTERTVRDTLWALATQQGRVPILAVDEAHLLTPRLLQELRFLLNYALDSTAPLVLLLCGHTELRQKLALRPLEAIRQRVTVAYQLPPLTAVETAAYCQHQLQHVGVDRPLFTDSALQAGFDWSRGIPRRVNTWARACLLAAYGAQQPLVDDGIAATAAEELQWAGRV
jgi:type II secretory pathway predicted ATPase ExeA